MEIFKEQKNDVDVTVIPILSMSTRDLVTSSDHQQQEHGRLKNFPLPLETSSVSSSNKLDIGLYLDNNSHPSD